MTAIIPDWNDVSSLSGGSVGWRVSWGNGLMKHTGRYSETLSGVAEDYGE